MVKVDSLRLVSSRLSPFICSLFHPRIRQRHNWSWQSLKSAMYQDEAKLWARASNNLELARRLLKQGSHQVLDDLDRRSSV